jgi:predicted transcriptional regulator
MAKPTLPRPTDGELSILRVLWERGPSTVRQVHEVLSRDRSAAYTTTLKLLQIMTEKGLVRRDDSDRSHIYQARMTQVQTQRQLVRDLLDRAFGGSSSKLVVQALAARRSTPEELGEIRRLLEERRPGKRQGDSRSDETDAVGHEDEARGGAKPPDQELEGRDDPE